MNQETVPLHIEQLAQRADLLRVVAAWIYNQWWTHTPEANVNTVADLLRGHQVHDEIPFTLVASSENHPVGTATLLPHDVGTEQWPGLSPWLAAVYVMPEHRRRGIGSRLVNAAVAKAAALGVETLYLLTTEREAFYARLGWRVVDRRGPEVVMSVTPSPSLVDAGANN